MLNEEKIKLMTRISLYEGKYGKKSLKSSRYFRNDYVGLNIINTILTVTLAFILMMILWFVYKADYFMDKLITLDFVGLGQRILLIYLIVMIVFCVIAYVVYSVKFDKMKEKNQEYADDLRDLYLLYKKEEKIRERELMKKEMLNKKALETQEIDIDNFQNQEADMPDIRIGGDMFDD